MRPTGVTVGCRTKWRSMTSHCTNETRECMHQSAEEECAAVALSFEKKGKFQWRISNVAQQSINSLKALFIMHYEYIRSCTQNYNHHFKYRPQLRSRTGNQTARGWESALARKMHTRALSSRSGRRSDP